MNQPWTVGMKNALRYRELETMTLDVPQIALRRAGLVVAGTESAGIRLFERVM